MREPFTYHGKVIKVLDDGISLLLTLDLGFYSFVKNQKFTFLGLKASDDPMRRLQAKMILENAFKINSDVIVETYMAKDGEFYIEIPDGDGVGISRRLLELKVAEYDEDIIERFGLQEKISNITSAQIEE